MKSVYITQVSKFLPNDPVCNDDMECILGMVGDVPSKARSLTLRSNKITSRHYALRDGEPTHTNADLAASAIKQLFNDDFKLEDLELLVCGTTGPDQLLPSHASMVHGLVGGRYEIVTTSGACLTGTQALKYAYMSILCGDKKTPSYPALREHLHFLKNNNFREKADNLKLIQNNPYVAFEKDFLRWMLSDGAAATLLQNEPTPNYQDNTPPLIRGGTLKERVKI